MRFLHFFLLTLATSASATTSLTFNGIVHSGPNLNFGDPVSFTLVLSDNPLASYSDGVYFDEQISLDVDLFSSFSGTGTTGTWSRPNAYDWLVLSNVSRTPGELFILMAVDGSGTFGGFESLQFGGDSITWLTFNLFFSSELNAPTGDYSKLFDGVSSAPSISIGYGNIKTVNGNSSDFGITSLAIVSGSTSVPEPSTYGLILGGLALAAAAIRRRSKL